jgi:hypothetical protein
MSDRSVAVGGRAGGRAGALATKMMVRANFCAAVFIIFVDFTITPGPGHILFLRILYPMPIKAKKVI